MMLEKHSDLLYNTDWKTLIILDACRFDFFARALEDVDLEGDLFAVSSEVTNTVEWYEKFWNGENEDIILVSANPLPWAGDVDVAENFYKSVWISDESDKKNQNYWQFPDATIRAYEKTDKEAKKCLIHFISPHLPFLGEEGKEFLRSLDTTDENKRGIYQEVIEWKRREKEHSWREIEEYYKENLDLVLGKIEQCLCKFQDPIVISSDHGELVGERDVFGHAPSVSSHPLLKIVPWFEVSHK